MQILMYTSLLDASSETLKEEQRALVLDLLDRKVPRLAVPIIDHSSKIPNRVGLLGVTTSVNSPRQDALAFPFRKWYGRRPQHPTPFTSAFRFIANLSIYPRFSRHLLRLRL